MSFHITSQVEYDNQYDFSKKNPEKFWDDIANCFQWSKKWSETVNYDLENGKVEWFKGAKLNITTNCLDRHLNGTKKDDIALIWEPNNPNDQVVKITYQELYNKVLQFARLLKDKNVQKGDRVSIYMPMIPEAIIAMLACARVGAIHSVVFAGFSANSLANRINDCKSKILITADELYRGEKTVPLLEIANEALADCDSITNVIIYKRSNREISTKKPYIIWQDEIVNYASQCEAEIVESSDPLFILYTSGSTGKPKGVVHNTAGYMVYTAYSFQNVFQYQDKDRYFCTADIGWITGHSYLVYGPLLCGATIVMYEGVPTYPNPSRFWDIIEKHQVNIFYTAPTAIRALMQKGDQYVKNYQLNSLKTLGTVGEPINKEAWEWYHNNIGKGRCPIVDTWWQTETGGILISSLAGVTKERATFASLPLPGVFPTILDNSGAEIEQYDQTGNLCFKFPWPSMLATTWGDHDRCVDTYYKRFKGYYFSGDGCFKSSDGFYRITGRVDDVINVSGHRFGTAEIENAINMHEDVTESAVIGIPHEVKGEGICAYVISNKNAHVTQDDITNIITKWIGNIAKPDKIFFITDLPKTRSGKIMRRILRKIAINDNNLGDTSTLINPEIITELQKVS